MIRKTIYAICALASLASYAVTVDISEGKKIQLLDMTLSQEKISSMQKNRLQKMTADEIKVSGDIKPMQKDLGMVNVPVLDQGQYGTCVTFAATAAMDARLSLGDFISQQCALQLNVALGSDLWNGAYFPSEVIDPLKKYGVISQTGCNAVYPARSTKISVEEYKKRIDLNASAEVSKLRYTYYSKNSLSSLKSAVSGGKRVLIAFLLNPNSKDGVRGYDVTVSGIKKQGGLWSCSAPSDTGGEPDGYAQCMESFPDFKWYCDWLFGRSKQVARGENCGQFQAGHEVIVTGFDDSQKLLKIRNSWGSSMGDSGDYYMTYEFFESQVVDMTEIL